MKRSTKQSPSPDKPNLKLSSPPCRTMVNAEIELRDGGHQTDSMNLQQVIGSHNKLCVTIHGLEEVSQTAYAQGCCIVHDSAPPSFSAENC